MIVCRQCGHSNLDGTAWCQRCNAFLEFEGEPQPGQSTAAKAGDPPDDTPPAGSGPPTEQMPVNHREPHIAGSGDAPTPADDIPPIRPGEIVCPVCGWGNEPSRRFCRHDGAVLVPPGGSRGQPDALKAGQRRRRTGHSNVLALALIALLVPALIATAVFVVIYLRPGGNGGGDNGDGKESPSPKPTAAEAVLVPPGAVKIQKFSSQSGGRVANNLLDGKPETFWSTAFPSGIPNNPGPNDIDRRPRLEFTFDPAVTLTRLEIINGASGAEFAQRPRAGRCILQFPDGTRQTFELDDQGTEFQTVEIKSPKRINSIVLHISTSYPGGKSADSGDRFRFSLAEVRFFQTA